MNSDRASYRNRGGLFQRLTTLLKSRHVTKCGAGVVIKRSVDMRVTDGAVLEIGDGVVIQDYAMIQLTKPSPKLTIGSNSVIGRFNVITAKNHVAIGNDVLIGSFVQIIDHGHGIARGEVIRKQEALIGEVVIGDDVWIGAGAKILMNVHIGRGAVIGANAVVTKNIPEYAIAVGAPAKVIGSRE